MVSYSSLWQDGHHVWQIKHYQSQGANHLDVSGDLPAEFERIRDAALRRRQAEEEAIRKKGRDPNKWGQHSPFGLPADYAFGVPLEVAAAITGFSHTRGEGWDLLTNLQALDGNVLMRLSHPPKWRQTRRSIEYK